jgi:nucleoside 2-deoxyribosyltransferase
MKKVYFAGSIRGGRDDAALYSRIIARINESARVLTEHVGAPSIEAMNEAGKTDRDIYIQDTNWLRESDLVIAECSTPSLGVGYELAFAEKLGKPAHIFFDTRRGTLSAMLTGDEYFRIHYYSSENELFETLAELLLNVSSK